MCIIRNIRLLSHRTNNGYNKEKRIGRNPVPVKWNEQRKQDVYASGT